jgi:hypothetical protein
VKYYHIDCNRPDFEELVDKLHNEVFPWVRDFEGSEVSLNLTLLDGRILEIINGDYLQLDDDGKFHHITKKQFDEKEDPKEVL